MPILVCDSIILQVFAYGDTSKILRLLTATHGLRSVIAKGARRPRSRYGGVLEPFTTGIATIYTKAGRDLQTLSAFELVRSHQALGSDLVRFAGASLVVEIVLRTGSEESQPHLFENLRQTLDRIQSSDRDTLESVILAAAWSLIAALGFAPELDECIDCGAAIAPVQPVRFDCAAGGVRCTRCAEVAPGKTLPAPARAALARLVTGDPVPLERTLGHWRLLGMFLDHHVLETGSLKSLSFLTDTLEQRCAS